MAKAVFLIQEFDTNRWVEFFVMEFEELPLWDLLMMELPIVGAARLQTWDAHNELVQDTHAKKVPA